MDCGFCGMEVDAEDSVSCQYCDDVFCGDCFDAHLEGSLAPTCGGDPPKEVVDAARKRLIECGVIEIEEETEDEIEDEW